MNPKKGEFVVHCIMCGKDFKAGDKAKCGGSYNGKPLCKTGDIQRELDRRLHQQKEPSNASFSRGPSGPSAGSDS